MVTVVPCVDAGAVRWDRPCIAILLGAPLNVQNLERTGIPYLSPHADIVIFDCQTWLGRSEAGKRHEVATWDPVLAVASATDMEHALQRYRPDYALDFIGLGPLTPVLQRMLAAAGTRFVVQRSGNIPLPSLFSSLAWKLRTRRVVPRPPPASAASSDVTSPAPSIFSRVRQKLTSAWALRRALRSPDIALLAGSSSLNHFTRRARHILWVGSQDFHSFRRLSEQQSDRPVASPYAVLIDDNIPYASDWALLGLSAPVTPELYYRAMRRLFTILEAQWGMPLVIAAHPSSRHDERVQQGFDGITLLHGCTAELVRHAEAVVLHGSTAVSFAALAQKPLLFLTSDELRVSDYGLYIEIMAKEFGLAPLNIDHLDSVPDLKSLSLSPDIHAKYLDRYVCRRGTSEPGPWAEFISHIKCVAPLGSKNESDRHNQLDAKQYENS